MLSAYLAANVVCGVSLVLQPQEHIKDIHWPTRAVAALEKGWVKPNEQLYLVEDGKPIAGQVEVVATWPDKSPKWVHAYAPFRYTGGQPAKYELEKHLRPPAPPASPLKVVDGRDGITIDTGIITLTIGRPFEGLSMVRHGQTVLLKGSGGPSLIDDRGIEWRARHDVSASVVIEQQGPAQVTVRASGWYQSAEMRVEPFCQFVTRITATAGSSIIKIDHATIFADDMRKHAISELAFTIPLTNVQGYSSGSEKGTFDEKLRRVWFAQLEPDRLLSLAETDVDKPVAPKVLGTGTKSPGWFGIHSREHCVVLLTKDLWQKCPKEVEIGPDRTVYYAWPKHGALSASEPADTNPEQIYKFKCFHKGSLLDSRLPGNYFQALRVQTDSQECKAEYARAANLAGVAMHNEFALVVLPQMEADRARAHLDALERLYVQDPIARVTPDDLAKSGALGPVATLASGFPEIERAVRDGMLGYARSIERYGDYGWAIYGNTHHEELMNAAAAGVPQGRPSLHRVWSNNHYQHVSTSWRLAALDTDTRLWDWARTCTDNYASIGQVRYDGLAGRIDGKNERHPGPEVKYHHPGAFWHCKAFVPWGGRDYGMDANDEDAALAGHWPDPSGLLYAWLLDGNRWAKDGYDLWRVRVKFPLRGTRREINTTLVHAITAHEYAPDDTTRLSIEGMAGSLASVAITEQLPGPLWEPTWLSRYHELAPDDKKFNEYVIKSADAVGPGIEAIWSLALSATAYDISGDEKYLRQHAGALARVPRLVFADPHSDKRWDKYGFGPGPDRDHHFMLQWPRFLAALKKAKIDSLPAPPEAGQYFCGSSRHDDLADVTRRGMRILVWREKEASFPLLPQGMTLSSGDIQTTSLEVLPPRGTALLALPRLFESATAKRVTRPSSFEAISEKYTVPASESGLHTILIGSNQVGVYQGLTDSPECQVLLNKKTPQGEARALVAKLARGYLVPLSNGKIVLTFTAEGVSDGARVRLIDAQKQSVLDRYLRAGESASVTINEGTAADQHWVLDAYADHTGFIRMDIEATIDEPLLFGAKLPDIQLIRQKIATATAARPATRSAGRP